MVHVNGTAVKLAEMSENSTQVSRAELGFLPAQTLPDLEDLRQSMPHAMNELPQCVGFRRTVLLDMSTRASKTDAQHPCNPGIGKHDAEALAPKFAAAFNRDRGISVICL